MASLLDAMKKEIQKAGSNKNKLLFVKEGTKSRIRFLTDLEEGVQVKFHDSYELGINLPCREEFDDECEFCDNEDLRTRSLYAFSVWDYEAKEVKIMLYAVNQCTPIAQFAAMYENYGTLLDRDYIVSVSGKAQNKTFVVIPSDKQKFRNSKVKAYSENALLKIIDKAFPYEDEETPKNKKRKEKKKEQAYDDDFDDEVEDDEVDYEDMTVKELYALCKERDLDPLRKKKARYYISLLEDDDAAEDDWSDDEEDDDFDDED
jgi:hypothetical protein